LQKKTEKTEKETNTHAAGRYNAPRWQTTGGPKGKEDVVEGATGGGGGEGSPGVRGLIASLRPGGTKLQSTVKQKTTDLEPSETPKKTDKVPLSSLHHKRVAVKRLKSKTVNNYERSLQRRLDP